MRGSARGVFAALLFAGLGGGRGVFCYRSAGVAREAGFCGRRGAAGVFRRPGGSSAGTARDLVHAFRYVPDAAEHEALLQRHRTDIGAERDSGRFQISVHGRECSESGNGFTGRGGGAVAVHAHDRQELRTRNQLAGRRTPRPCPFDTGRLPLPERPLCHL